MYKFLAALCLVCAVAADNPYQARSAYQARASYDDVPSYNYEWAVKDDYSGNDFAAQESRDGYNTNGNYRVLLPDGRVQSVTYSVQGDAGYIADVQYAGEPRYDSYKPAPSYRQPVYAPAPKYGHQ